MSEFQKAHIVKFTFHLKILKVSQSESDVPSSSTTNRVFLPIPTYYPLILQILHFSMFRQRGTGNLWSRLFLWIAQNTRDRFSCTSVYLVSFRDSEEVQIWQIHCMLSVRNSSHLEEHPINGSDASQSFRTTKCSYNFQTQSAEGLNLIGVLDTLVLLLTC